MILPLPSPLGEPPESGAKVAAMTSRRLDPALESRLHFASSGHLPEVAQHASTAATAAVAATPAAEAPRSFVRAFHVTAITPCTVHHAEWEHKTALQSPRLSRSPPCQRPPTAPTLAATTLARSKQCRTSALTPRCPIFRPCHVAFAANKSIQQQSPKAAPLRLPHRPILPPLEHQSSTESSRLSSSEWMSRSPFPFLQQSPQS